MPREIKTAKEIQVEMQRRITARMGDDEDVVGVHLPVALETPDGDGCNWTVLGFTGDRGYYKLVGLAVFEVKEIWNLG